MMRLLLFLTLAAFLLDGSALAAPRKQVPESKRIRVLLNSTATVEGEKYRLGEIARLEGEDFKAVERLSQIVIGRSPLPGRRLTVTQSLIRSRLRSGRFDVNRLEFPSLESTTIQRLATRIPGEDIDQVVLEHIRKTNRNSDIKPRLLASSRDLFLPRGDISYEIQERGTHRKEGGYWTYEVLFSVDSKLVQKVPVRTYLKVYKEVYVAKHEIRSETVVQESDLLAVRRTVDRMPQNYVTDKQQLVGKIATRHINPKEVLKGSSFSTPPLVKVGDRLLIVYETPNLLLSVQGVSMAKGHLGERIPVRNTESKMVVYAQVKSRNLVQVN